MRDDDYAKLLEDTQRELLAGAGPAGVLGLTPVTLRLLASLAASGADRAVEVVYAPPAAGARLALAVPVLPFDALSEAGCGVLVVAADAEKEDLLFDRSLFFARPKRSNYLDLFGLGTAVSAEIIAERLGRRFTVLPPLPPLRPCSVM